MVIIWLMMVIIWLMMLIRTIIVEDGDSNQQTSKLQQALLVFQSVQFPSVSTIQQMAMNQYLLIQFLEG